MTGLDIVAIGARTPLGLLAEPSAAAVRAGVTRICDYPFVTEQGDLMAVAADSRLQPRIEGTERLLALASSAVDEVFTKLDGLAAHNGPVVVLLALPEARPGLTETEIEAVVAGITTRVQGKHAKVAVVVAGYGHAATAVAVERAVQAQGRIDDAVTLVVGVDSYHRPETFVWLESLRLFGTEARNGFLPGEAAGCIALAPAALRKHLRLPCLAQVGGVGTAQEQLLPGCDTGSFGEGITAAIRAAVTGLTLPDDAVDDVYADINGERYRSEEWGFAAMRFHAAFKALRYHAPASWWGDIGAATGVLGMVLAVQAWARGYATGPRALVLNGSRNGSRGAVLLQQP